MTLQAVIYEALYVDKLMERDNRKHGKNLDRPNTRADPQQNQGKRTAVAEQDPTSSQPSQEGQSLGVIDKAGVQCYYCKNYGHYKSDCRKLAFAKNRDRNQGNEQLVARQGANVTNTVPRPVNTVETITEGSSTSWS